MGSLAAHVRGREHSVLEYLVLDVQMPLLHVRPDSFGRNRDHSQRELQTSAADLVVANDIKLCRSLDQRRRAFQRLNVPFVAVGVLEEDAVAAAQSRLAIAEYFPG